MPKKTSLVDYHSCNPDRCKRGICIASIVCPYKIIKQEEPFEIPTINQAMCMGCGLCVEHCPMEAIHIVAI